MQVTLLWVAGALTNERSVCLACVAWQSVQGQVLCMGALLMYQVGISSLCSDNIASGRCSVGFVWPVLFRAGAL